MKSDFIPEELTLLDPSPANSHYAETFVYTPANTQENLLGNLYIVSSLYSTKGKKENSQIISEIASIIKNEYYKNTITTPISALRFALKKANNFLAAPKITDSRENGKTRPKSADVKPADLLKLRVAVAVLRQNTLHISKMGEVTSLILRGDILQPVMPEPQKNKISKIQQPMLFENIVSGEIMSDDHLILATNQIYKISEADLISGLRDNDITKKITHGEKMLDAASGLWGLSLIALRPAKTPRPELAIPVLQQDRKTTLAASHNIPEEAPWEKEIREYNKESGLEQMEKKKRVRKTILLVAVILVIANSVAFVVFKLKSETSIKRKESESLVKEITDLRDKISPLVEIGNEKEATELLNEAQTKLNRLNELGYFQTTRVSLGESLEKLTKDLQHLEQVSTLRTVVDLENNSAGFEPEYITPGKNKIVVFNKNTVYKFDLNRSLGNFDMLGQDYNIKSAIEDPNDQNKILLLSDNKIVLHGDSEDKEIWQKPAKSPNLLKFREYAGSLYLLAENGAIYKLALPLMAEATTTEETAAPNPVFSLWLNPSTKIEPPPTDFAVEGSVFAINQDNIIFELVNGRKRNQTELLERVSQIFSLSSQKNVYLLAPDQGLIVVIDKSGTIKKRLSHPELSGAKSFFVNSQERVVYFLKGKKVFSFEI